MASKIQSYNFYVAIKPYKLEGISNEYNEVSVYVNYDSNRKHFYVSLHAGWCGGSFHGCTLYDGRGWLTDTQFIILKDSPKNSQKTINEMGAALELAKADIAWLFDERMFTQLQQFVKDVALYGYTAMLEERIRSYKNERTVTAQVNAANNSNNQTSEDESMKTNENNIETKNVAMEAQVNNQTTDVDVAEVDDIKPVVTKRAVAESMVQAANGGPATTMPLGSHGTLVIAGVGSDKPKTTKSGKPSDRFDLEKDEPKVTLRKETSQVQDSVAAAESTDKGGKLTYATYEKQKTNKTTGKPYTVTHAKIMGFAETDEAYQMGAALHGAVSGEMVDGVKVLGLYFSHRYTEAAKMVCDALNAGKTFAECVAIIDNATEENAKKRQEWKAKIEERKQKREERKAAREANTDSTDKTDKPAAPAMDAKDKELFELFKKFMAGDKSAMEQVGTMMTKKAA